MGHIYCGGCGSLNYADSEVCWQCEEPLQGPRRPPLSYLLQEIAEQGYGGTEEQAYREYRRKAATWQRGYAGEEPMEELGRLLSAVIIKHARLDANEHGVTSLCGWRQLASERWPDGSQDLMRIEFQVSDDAEERPLLILGFDPSEIAQSDAAMERFLASASAELRDEWLRDSLHRQVRP